MFSDRGVLAAGKKIDDGSRVLLPLALIHGRGTGRTSRLAPKGRIGSARLASTQRRRRAVGSQAGSGMGQLDGRDVEGA